MVENTRDRFKLLSILPEVKEQARKRGRRKGEGKKGEGKDLLSSFDKSII